MTPRRQDYACCLTPHRITIGSLRPYIPLIADLSTRKFRVPATSSRISARADLETLPCRRWKTMFCQVWGAGRWCSLSLCAAGAETSFRRFLSRSGNSVLPPSEGRIFRANRGISLAMFSQHRPHPLPAPLIPFPILPSSCDSNSLERVLAPVDHHLPAPFHFFIIFLLSSATSAGTLVPFRHSRPPALSSHVNQNSMRKRGQMYTTRGARRTGCPERSPTAIDFRRLDGISAKICHPESVRRFFRRLPRRQHEYQTFWKTLWSLGARNRPTFRPIATLTHATNTRRRMMLCENDFEKR